MSLEHRLAQLERENRRWKKFAFLALIAGVAFFMLHQGAVPSPLAAQEIAKDMLTVQKLVLKDKNGKEVFLIDANWPGCDGALVLKDP